MAKDFEVGDHVSWNSEAGRVRGTVKKKITSEIKFKGYTVRASKEEPQYLIQSLEGNFSRGSNSLRACPPLK